MKLTTALVGAAALGLASAPLVAAERVSAPVEGENELVGISPVLLVLAVASVVAGVILIADDDDNPISA